MRKILLLTVVLFCNTLITKAEPLSPDAKISLLTCAPGNEIYSYFGHTAIRVTDPVSGTDYVFNYGAFSFESKNFFWNFAKGRTDYQLVVQRMNSFMREYEEEQRSVSELLLDLTPVEKQLLYDALAENYKPENRIYRYNHFLDNCATRVRDQFEKAVSGKLAYDKSGNHEMSFRDLIKLYLPNNSWIGLGIHLALGMATDRKATFAEKMFLPDYLEADMSKATVAREGKNVPFTQPRKILFEAQKENEPFNWWSPKVVILIFLLTVTASTIIEYFLKKRWIELDFVIFFIFGIAGILLTFLSFSSELEGTARNLNLLWAWPIHTIFAFVWTKGSWRKYTIWYLKVLAVSVALFLLIMPIVPQGFHPLTAPLALILLFRSANVFLPATKK
jgi:hypothetical protein